MARNEYGQELDTLKKVQRREIADMAYDRIVDFAQNPLLRLEEPKTYLAANQWLHEQGYGKAPENIIHHQGARWEMAIEGIVVHVGGGQPPMPRPLLPDPQYIDVMEASTDDAMFVFDYT